MLTEGIDIVLLRRAVEAGHAQWTAAVGHLGGSGLLVMRELEYLPIPGGYSAAKAAAWVRDQTCDDDDQPDVYVHEEGTR